MAKKSSTEWVMIDGLMVKRIVKRGRIRLSYPDPFGDDFVEGFLGSINFMRQIGTDEATVQQSIKEFEEKIHGPQPAPLVPMPKEFSAQDEFRAHGMGIRLRELD